MHQGKDHLHLPYREDTNFAGNCFPCKVCSLTPKGIHKSHFSIRSKQFFSLYVLSSWKVLQFCRFLLSEFSRFFHHLPEYGQFILEHKVHMQQSLSGSKLIDLNLQIFTLKFTLNWLHLQGQIFSLFVHFVLWERTPMLLVARFLNGM